MIKPRHVLFQLTRLNNLKIFEEILYWDFFMVNIVDLFMNLKGLYPSYTKERIEFCFKSCNNRRGNLISQALFDLKPIVTILESLVKKIFI